MKCKNLERFPKKMNSTANTTSGESLRNMCRISKDKQESLEKLLHAAYHITLRGGSYTDFVHELEDQILQKVQFFTGGLYENKSDNLW